MIKIYRYADMNPEEIFNRKVEQNDEVEGIVAGIIDRVRKEGDAALLDYAEQFDHCRLEALEVSAQEIQAAFERTDKAFIQTLEMAAQNIRAFHRRQIRQNFMINDQEGVVLGQRVGGRGAGSKGDAH